MAYFFIPPAYVFDIGVDDGIRFVVFEAVGGISAWLSGRRRHAESSQRTSVRELENSVMTLKRMSGCPGICNPWNCSALRT